MPTLLIIGPYRFFFYSANCSEPPHVHIERDSSIAKVWLTTLQIAEPGGFNQRELKRIIRLITERREELLRGWNEHCNQ